MNDPIPRIRQAIKAAKENKMPSSTAILRSDSFVDVPGLLFEHEGYCLQELASGRNVLEIGPHMGRSTIAMAYSANKVTSVDHFDGDRMAPHVSPANYHQNVLRTGAGPKTAIHQGDFFAFVKDGTINLYDFDMFFYDANHEPPEPYELDFFELIYAAMELSKDPKPRIVSCHDWKPAEPAFKWVVEAAAWFTYASKAPMQGNAEHGSVRWWEVEF
jgi:hypothetical protein